MIIEKIILEDGHPLYGGVRFFMNGAGLVVFEDANFRNRIKSNKYKSRLSKDKLEEIEELIEKHDFFNIITSDRPGIPDESHPQLTIKLKSGEEKTIRKWANDSHPDFDALYDWINLLISQIKQVQEPYYAGDYDITWKPEGF